MSGSRWDQEARELKFLLGRFVNPGADFLAWSEDMRNGKNIQMKYDPLSRGDRGGNLPVWAGNRPPGPLSVSFPASAVRSYRSGHSPGIPPWPVG